MRPPPVLLLPAPQPAAALALPPGWRGRDGFALPAAPWDLGPHRWICVGPVTGPEGAEAAVTALARGVGLAVALEVEGDLRHRLLEDLHRAGAVEVVLADAPAGPQLDADQRRLLAALAEGATLRAAADAVHVSLRTAHRRLADARRRLGVTTTAEAVTRAAGGRAGPGAAAPGGPRAIPSPGDGPGPPGAPPP